MCEFLTLLQYPAGQLAWPSAAVAADRLTDAEAVVAAADWPAAADEPVSRRFLQGSIEPSSRGPTGRDQAL